MPPESTLWPLEDHTLGKHRVLRNYMKAWLPKMLQSGRRRVLFIDGFAGPGEYKYGEDGSPIIALKSFTQHSAFDRMRGRITFVFIEKELDRAMHLKKVAEPYMSKLPDDGIRIFNSSFGMKMMEILDLYEDRQRGLPPAFVMIDPFGVADAPMHVIRRILACPSTEVYISFMYDAFNRFRAHPVFEDHLDGLFGCPEWREGLDIPEGDVRKRFYYGLYERCLREAGANHVLSFELYGKERLIYTIFFATQRSEGCDVMKQAMWKTAPFGDFKFMSGAANQLTLGIEPTDFTLLRKALHSEFGNEEWVSVDDVMEFVRSDKTEFHSGHLKTKTLRPMERDREIEVKPGTRKTRGYFPKGAMLKFVRP
ncbi:MAG: three-Cys-motif partner protein TcmP [Caldilineaceae bacterium]|nr:three-Cys-motif partner protein TcmP [Caldilineaceae bacterium]